MAPRTGLSLVELLVVLAVLSLVGTWFGLRPVNGLAADARSLAGVVALARARAAADGTRVTVFGAICSTTSSVAWRGITAAVVSEPPRGLLFTPDGLPRTCDGGGVGNTTILLEHRGRQAAVIVSSLGRVRWELR
ncbi:MAG: prepilin-type N-terminal cleavage/methylation domain-containing protein [Trueperaceae bacterium]